MNNKHSCKIQGQAKLESELEIGHEIIKTRDGKIYEGIFMAIHKGHLFTVARLEIIFTFPINAVVNVIKL
ncbi:MAG: hypothetical protein HYV97_05945 [Bdellovibrio sp.]|nr:hypothetical protein [Bdellovibrio sp.]